MGTGVIYVGQMPLKKWEEMYNFGNPVWRLRKDPTDEVCVCCGVPFDFGNQFYKNKNGNKLCFPCVENAKMTINNFMKITS